MFAPRIVYKTELNEMIKTILIKRIHFDDTFHPDIFFAVQNHRIVGTYIHYDFVIYLYDDTTNPNTDDYFVELQLIYRTPDPDNKLEKLSTPLSGKRTLTIGNYGGFLKVANIEIPTFYPYIYPLKYQDYESLPWEK
jgi:hypothetical protein